MKRFFLVITIVILVSLGTAEQMPQMPDFPEIEAPTIGSGFYQPKIPYYPKSPSAPNKANTAESTTETTISNANTTNDNLLSALLGSNSMLTAADITSLYYSGSFTTLGTLYGNTNSTMFASTSSSDIILKQILLSLEDLKAEQKKNSSSDNEELATKQQDLTTFKEREPSILRFKINGYDIKDSLTTVYFSKPEADGSFLLTADRRYIADRQIRNETFYLLFRATKSQGHTITYDVEPSIMQDNKNENSFIYKLCNQKKLTATKTGNLVVLREDRKDATVDLLLDIDK